MALSSPPPEDTMPPPVSILNLRAQNELATAAEPLSESIIADLQVPASTAERPYRSLSTMLLYSEEGLRLYEDITAEQDYYVFGCELEILEKYGDEIACRMFGLPTEVLTQAYLNGSKGGNGVGGNEKHAFDPTPAANGAAKKEKWGDPIVGTNNNGVNGGLCPSSRLGLAIELGSGSLEKTRHLLRSLSKLLKPTSNGSPPFAGIEYRALDLERESLVSTLSKLVKQETNTVSATEDRTARVVVSGIAATYDEGLAFLSADEHVNGGANGANGAANGSHATGNDATNGHRVVKPQAHKNKSILWLGSSIGNFSRPGAVEFLKNIVDKNLQRGDTMLIGIDNCNEPEMICTGYNDPKGATARFILEGVNHAGRILHGNLPGAGGLLAENFDYVSQWNAELGRHEAYVCPKVDGLVISLPAAAKRPAHKIALKPNELIRIEESYKYTQVEARALFNASGLRLVQQWSDSRQLHSIYLLEKPGFFFPLTPSLEIAGPAVNPCGVPTIAEWETLWKSWDAVTLEIVPRKLLLTKPIPLRHPFIFYLGHIPAFADIFISRHLGLPLTEPAGYAEIFERGIDPDVDDPSKINHSHSTVPAKDEDWPRLDDILAYEGRVRERIRKVYQDHGGKMTRRLARVLALIFEHEAMHNETLVYIALQASSSLLASPTWQAPDFPSLSRFWDRTIAFEGPDARRSILTFEATKIAIGHDDDDTVDEQTPYDPAHEIGWDVESPRRVLDVKAFRIDALPVTNGDYLAWLVRRKEGVEEKLVPASWATGGELGGLREDGIRVKTLAGEVRFEYGKHWPVAGSAYQLGEFAKSKGGRLPTQGELSVFLRQNPVDSPAANLGFANLHPVPATLPHVQRDGTTSHGTDGGVWGWTSDFLEAHEGYKASLLYPGYSSDFHDGTHAIVLGGSYVTPPRLARATFVNWYQAKYPYILGGARVTYDYV